MSDSSIGMTSRLPRITSEPRWSHSEIWREMSVSWLIRLTIWVGPYTRLLGEAIQHQPAVVLPVVSRHHPRGQVVLAAWRERHHQDELRLPLLRQPHHDVAQEGVRPLARPRQHRLLPLVLPVVKDLRLGH